MRVRDSSRGSAFAPRADGTTWSYNAHVLIPDVSVYLEDDPEVIAARLLQRPALSRLETRGSPARELALYQEAFRFLARQGWPQARIDCRGLDPDSVVAKVMAQLGPPGAQGG